MRGVSLVYLPALGAQARGPEAESMAARMLPGRESTGLPGPGERKGKGNTSHFLTTPGPASPRQSHLPALSQPPVQPVFTAHLQASAARKEQLPPVRASPPVPEILGGRGRRSPWQMEPLALEEPREPLLTQHGAPDAARVPAGTFSCCSCSPPGPTCPSLGCRPPRCSAAAGHRSPRWHRAARSPQPRRRGCGRSSWDGTSPSDWRGGRTLPPRSGNHLHKNLLLTLNK